MADEVKCNERGALYERTMRHSPFKDKDDFQCEACGHVMDERNATTYPTYTLISRLDAESDN